MNMIVHQAIHHGLKSCFIPGRICRIENRSDSFESRRIGSRFVVYYPDALIGTVYAIDETSDENCLFLAFDTDFYRHVKTVLHSQQPERTYLFIVRKHLPEVFFDYSQDQFVAAAIDQPGNFRVVYF